MLSQICCSTGLVMFQHVFLFLPPGSGPNDHVFVYFTDHGAPGLLAFPNDDVSTFHFLCTFHRARSFQPLAHTLLWGPNIFEHSCEN